MAMMTEPATTRKRNFSMQQADRSPSWISSPFVSFTPFGLANGSDITPPFEKRPRSMKSTFKWEPDVNGALHFTPGKTSFSNVRTPLPPAWRHSTPPTVRNSRENYERVKNEMKERDWWYAKLDYSTGLAENALDVVGRPTLGLKLTLGPTESYYEKFVHAKRELEDYKRVVHAVNSFVPLVSSDKFSSLESMKRQGSNLQQGPRNLYNMQGSVVRETQRGGNDAMENGSPKEVDSVHAAAAPVDDQGEAPEALKNDADVPKDDGKKERWQMLFERFVHASRELED